MSLILPDKPHFWVPRFENGVPKKYVNGQFAGSNNIQFGEPDIVPPFIGDTTLTSVSLVTFTRSQGLTIAWPAGLAAGDVAVLLQYVGDTYSDAYMSGGTSIHYFQVTGAGSQDSTNSASYKILTGTETGSITGVSNADNTGKILFIFRGNIPITSVAFGSWSTAGANGLPSARTITASGQPTPLINLGLSSQQFADGDFGTVTPAWDATYGSLTNTTGWSMAGYKIYNSSPANASVGGISGSSSAIMAGYIRVSA